MVCLKYLAALFALSVLAACGGGGGNAGTPTGGATVTCTAPLVLLNGVCGTAPATPAATLLSAQLKDAGTGAAVSSVAAAAATDIVAVLATTDGKPAPGLDVTVDSSASSLLTFPNGVSATTDANGVAKIRVGRANLYEFGSVALALASKSSASYAAATSSLVSRVDPPPLQLELRDAANALTTTVGSSGLTTLKATLKFPDGTPIKQKRVDITGDLTKISFPEGNAQLTDSLGVATIKVTRASATAGGAGTLTGAATISGSSIFGPLVTTVVTGALDYSVGAVVGAAALALDPINVGAASLAAYGTSQITVRAMLGTSVAPSVQVSFSSSCGQISPATAPTNSNGIATVSFTATDVTGTVVSTLGCGGKTVDISASAVGASSVSTPITVTAAPPTNLSFVVPADPTKSRIYLANSGGATQTIVQFLLSNARGEPLPSQNVTVFLKTSDGTTPAVGATPVKASFVAVGNTDPKTLTTDSFGKISVPVFSGTVPTNVLVNAVLASTIVTPPKIQTDSSVVVIASGRPVQSRVSLVPAKHAIRGFDFDGATTTVTMSLADRQGNPVPDGTAVNFVTKAGVMIPPTCVTGAVPGDSQCTVSIRTQNPRPFATDNTTKNGGYVSILAYTAGEEDFKDENFNNTFDAPELFTDLGTAYRDDFATATLLPGEYKWNRDGSRSTTIQSFDGTMYVQQPGEFAVPRAAETGGTTPLPNQGDGVWGAADVRGQVVIVFSTDDLSVVGPLVGAALNSAAIASTIPTGWIGDIDPQWNGRAVATGLKVSIQDLNGRSVPTGSTIAVAVTDNSPKLPTDGDPVAPTIGTCSLISQSHTAVPDALEPLTLTLNLKQCITGDQVGITVTTPAMAKTYAFTVP